MFALNQFQRRRCLLLLVLRFYSPVNSMGSCPALSVYLATFLLGRLSPLRVWPVLCIFSYCSWISGRERMTVGNITGSIPMKDCCKPGRGRTGNLLITSPTCIQLSHRVQGRSCLKITQIYTCILAAQEQQKVTHLGQKFDSNFLIVILF